MIDNQTLIGRLRFANRGAFLELAECLDKPTVYEALTLLLDEKFTVKEIADKFDIEYFTMRSVLAKIRPTIEELRVRGISTTRSERYGLRLADGTLLRDHCRRLNLGAPQSAAYTREKRRLAKANNLLTAEEYQRTLRHTPRC